MKESHHRIYPSPRENHLSIKTSHQSDALRIYVANGDNEGMQSPTSLLQLQQQMNEESSQMDLFLMNVIKDLENIEESDRKMHLNIRGGARSGGGGGGGADSLSTPSIGIRDDIDDFTDGRQHEAKAVNNNNNNNSHNQNKRNKSGSQEKDELNKHKRREKEELSIVRMLNNGGSSGVIAVDRVGSGDVKEGMMSMVDSLVNHRDEHDNHNIQHAHDYDDDGEAAVHEKGKLREGGESKPGRFRTLMSSSTIVGEDYFKQDEEVKLKEQMRKAEADITNFKSYFVKFRMSQFFEFFFYHGLFYVLLGPLSSLIIRYFGRSLPHNLLFAQLRLSFVYQTIFFMCTWLTYTMYYLLDCPNIFFQSEVMLVIAVILTRCMVIAFKYATFDPVKIQVIRHHDLTFEEIASDFYLVDWFGQTDRVIHDETYFGLRVYDIDPGMFYVDFMVPPDKKTMANAEKYVEDLKKHHKSKTPFEVPGSASCQGEHSNSQIYGYAVMKEFSMTFDKTNEFIKKYVYYISQAYGFYRAFLPTLFRCIDGVYPWDYEWQELIIAFCVAWNTRQIYFYSIWQLTSGFLDIKRKVFQQHQLAFMIAPRKLRNLDCFKIYPTINIFKMNTLKGWQCIRQVCLEFGRSYFIRVQALFSSYFLLCLSLLTLLALGVFKVITLEKPMIAVIISDIVVFLVLIMLLVYYCAQANEMFGVHENILKGNKSICSDIYRNRSFWFRDGFRSTNYIYNKGVEKIKAECQNYSRINLECKEKRAQAAGIAAETGNRVETEEIVQVAAAGTTTTATIIPGELLEESINPVEYTLELIRDYEEHIADLQFDSENYPVTLLGVKITFGLLQSVLITLGSVVATLAASYFNQLTNESATTTNTTTSTS